MLKRSRCNRTDATGLRTESARLRWGRYGGGLLALAATLLAGSAAADDTEIFVRAIPPADPNVVLVVDTSGSMLGQLVVAEDYDPNVVYDGACDFGRVYWEPRGTNDDLVPDCSPSSFRYSNVDAIFCDAANQAFMSAGYFTDRFAQWDSSSGDWEGMQIAVFTDPPGETRPVECAADNGLHGDGIDEAAVFPIANANETSPGPWTADPANAITWAEYDSYTFYSANYLNWLNGEREQRVSTRMEVIKGVASDLVTSVGGMNVGLLRFSSNNKGGMVLHPAIDIDVPANRDALNAAIADLQPGGSTPLSETLYEAQRYLSGSAVTFGLDSLGNDLLPQPSVASSRNGDQYVSPMSSQCQASYVVVLTDGQPQDDTDDAVIDIQSLIGGSCTGNCLDELTSWMAQNNQSPTGDALDPDTVLTYTIGFFVDDPLLLSAATATKPDPDPDDGIDPDPGYYTANDVRGLTDALREVFEDIEAQNTSFQSPSVSVDGFNRLVNSDDLYFSMFIPSGAPHWAGNIKHYRLADVNSSLEIVDADGKLAIDGGSFREDARSYWSDEVDGADVLAGGIRNRMGTGRKIFTDTSYAGANVPLWSDTNRFDVTNEFITPAMIGVAEEDFPEMMQFLSGVDAEGGAAPIFGDPLHSNPLLITFADSGRNTTRRMFVATNDGYFHSFNVEPTSDTQAMEEWSFIPSQMLSKLYQLKDNEVQNPARKGYGIDGPLSFWIKDDDGDNVVESGETLFIFMAMRRGGRDYMAISIPGGAPSQPTLEWTIRGGSGNFAEMGQSWSAATVARMEVNGSDRVVLVLGGGYDANSQDPAGPPQADSMGRAIYVVDALTGQRLWWAGPPGAAGGTPDLILDDMTNAIPSDLTVVDTGGDGVADRLYVGDMGGRVWRVDVGNLPNEASGTVFADLGDATESGNRRFYYAPSVSRVLDEVFGSFLTISIGTGHRASPLSTAVDDRFYMLRDVNVFSPPLDADNNVLYPPPITEEALLDITTNISPTAEQLNGTLGWMLRLVASAGEKNLSPATTADNKVFFSTYYPDDGSEPDCNLANVIGGGLLYTVDLVTGIPVQLDDPLDDGNVTPSDRYQNLDLGGIPPAPQLIFTACDGPCPGEQEDGGDGEGGGEGDGQNVGNGAGCENAYSQVTLLIGTETNDPGICNAPVRTFWRQNK